MWLSCPSLICSSSDSYLEHKQPGNSFIFIELAEDSNLGGDIKCPVGIKHLAIEKNLASQIFEPATFYLVLWIHNAIVSSCVFRSLDFFFPLSGTILKVIYIHISSLM